VPGFSQKDPLSRGRGRGEKVVAKNGLVRKNTSYQKRPKEGEKGGTGEEGNEQKTGGKTLLDIKGKAVEAAAPKGGNMKGN